MRSMLSARSPSMSSRVGRDHEHAGEIRVTHEMAEQPKGRAVGPVEVLDDEHERRIGQPGQRGRDRLEEPELRGDVAVGLVVGGGLAVDQVGEHQSERRGERRALGGVGPLHHLAQDLHDGLVVGAGLGIAMSHEHADPAALGVGAELLGERGLADAGRARDEHERPGGFGRVTDVADRVERFEEAAQLDPAPDEAADRRPGLGDHVRCRALGAEVEARTL